MTLYLRVTVGKTAYLLPAARVTYVAPAEEESLIDTAIPEIDCRLLFDEPAGAPGHRVSLAGEADLIVDHVDGLTVRADEMFRRLPPIGRFGGLIDAVSLPVANESPALRLKVDLPSFTEMLSAVRAG